MMKIFPFYTNDSKFQKQSIISSNAKYLFEKIHNEKSDDQIIYKIVYEI